MAKLEDSVPVNHIVLSTPALTGSDRPHLHGREARRFVQPPIEVELHQFPATVIYPDVRLDGGLEAQTASGSVRDPGIVFQQTLGADGSAVAAELGVPHAAALFAEVPRRDVARLRGLHLHVGTIAQDRPGVTLIREIIGEAYHLSLIVTYCTKLTPLLDVVLDHRLIETETAGLVHL